MVSDVRLCLVFVICDYPDISFLKISFKFSVEQKRGANLPILLRTYIHYSLIQNCQQHFDVEVPSNLWAKRACCEIEKKFVESINSFCNIIYSLCSLICIVLLVKFSLCFFSLLSATVYSE